MQNTENLEYRVEGDKWAPVTEETEKVAFESIGGYFGSLSKETILNSLATLSYNVRSHTNIRNTVKYKEFKKIQEIEKEERIKLAEKMEIEWAKQRAFENKNHTKCDCGCLVDPKLVMKASTGTSCSECYDRMSD